MKKIWLLFVVLALFVYILAGCSKTGICEECGQSEKLTKFVESDGTVHLYCNDCYRIAKLFTD